MSVTGFKTPKQETKLGRSFHLFPPTLDNVAAALKQSEAAGIVHGDTANGEIDIEFKTVLDAVEFANAVRVHGWHLELRHDLSPVISFWASVVVTIDPFIYVELKDGNVLQLSWSWHGKRWVVWAPDEITRVGSLEPLTSGGYMTHQHTKGMANTYIGTFPTAADAVEMLWRLWPGKKT